MRARIGHVARAIEDFTRWVSTRDILAPCTLRHTLCPSSRREAVLHTEECGFLSTADGGRTEESTATRYAAQMLLGNLYAQLRPDICLALGFSADLLRRNSLHGTSVALRGEFPVPPNFCSSLYRLSCVAINISSSYYADQAIVIINNGEVSPR